MIHGFFWEFINIEHVHVREELSLVGSSARVQNSSYYIEYIQRIASLMFEYYFSHMIYYHIDHIILIKYSFILDSNNILESFCVVILFVLK
ncbi:uncharacterized protein OCT59_022208 [Rhizophagus irregularis]|uniref:uncharacterized protein n=1 Tax=Rhizophagus irregularis TaxID=588596 RepID=UPI0019EB7153|nr:hypothetical protein OCT59_022208 [Rhizophagus irregularis]GET56296.1 hypothetical protein RIR_jg36867.t1 [Rhizophagus irregularis DAOM 181602=DAOM 197198]